MAKATIQFGPLFITHQWSFSFGPGVSPSVCTIQTPPARIPGQWTGATEPLVHDLVIFYDGAEIIRFTDCLLEKPSLSVQGRHMWSLPLQDRRWRWERFGEINGNFNETKGDGTYLREKTPQELAQLLVEAMGDVNADVSGLPDGPRPRVLWDRAHPASELQRLCSQLGCIVTLDPSDDRLKIFRISQNINFLPVGLGEKVIGFGSRINVQVKPKTMRINGGETLCQGEFECEAVGLDQGKIRLIDDLPYKPPGGWETSYPPSHIWVEGTYMENGKTLQNRDQAVQCMWKMWRVNGIVGTAGPRWGPQVFVGSEFEAISREDIELLGTLVDEETQTDGTKKRLPIRIFTDAWHHTEGQPDEGNLRLWPGGASVDSREGVITTQDPLYRWTEQPVDPSGTGSNSPGTSRHIVAPTVRVEIGYKIKPNGIYHRHFRDREVDANAFGVQSLLRSEIIRTVKERYDEVGNLNQTEDNEADLTAQMDFHLDAEEQKFSQLNALTVEYSGIRAFSLDGMVRQISWTGGINPATTTVSQAAEHNPWVPSWERKKQKISDEQLERARVTRKPIEFFEQFENIV